MACKLGLQLQDGQAVIYKDDIYCGAPGTWLADYWSGPRYAGRLLLVLVSCEMPPGLRKLLSVLHDLMDSAQTTCCV